MLSIKTTLVLCNDPRDDRAKFEAPILLFASRGANFSRVLGHHSVLRDHDIDRRFTTENLADPKSKSTTQNSRKLSVSSIEVTGQANVHVSYRRHITYLLEGGHMPSRHTSTDKFPVEET